MKITRRSVLGLALMGASSTLLGTPVHAASNQIVKLSKVKVGATYSFQLKNGAPALLFRTKTGVFAYQTICPHQGGLAKYFAPRKLIICPVHNASFDPFKKGAVVAGPATRPLTTIKVAIKGEWIILT